VDEQRAIEPRVLLGGTFDPVHVGHLGLANDVRSALGVGRVHLLPARDPPHRPPPGASAPHRLAMLELAIRGRDGLAIDRRELDRAGPSYTATTLEELEREAPSRPIVLVMGADAFRGLPAWHRWTRILDLAHIAVAARPGDPFDAALPAELLPLWHERRVADAAALRLAPAGRIMLVPIRPQDVSASAIRRALAGDAAARAGVRPLLPPGVWDYIAEHRLYAALP